MGIEKKVFCDLCGDEIEEENDDGIAAHKDYTVSIGKLMGETETDIDMYKYLCEDCAREVYNMLKGLDWEE